LKPGGCAAAGITDCELIAVIGDSVLNASIGLHLRQGFCIAGALHTVGGEHGRWRDSVLVQRRIGDLDSTSPL
jgi:phosphinothricin acetyltransferase